MSMMVSLIVVHLYNFLFLYLLVFLLLCEFYSLIKVADISMLMLI